MRELRRLKDKNTIGWQRLCNQPQPLLQTSGLLRLRAHQAPDTDVVTKVIGQGFDLSPTSQGGYVLGGIRRDIGLLIALMLCRTEGHHCPVSLEPIS